MVGESAYEALLSLVGPFGPLVEEAELAATRRRLVSGDPVRAAGALLEALRRPSPAWATREDVEVVAGDLLAVLTDHPGVVTMLLDGVADPRTRVACLDALGGAGQERAATDLADLAATTDLAQWSEHELLRLVAALGSMDGEAAGRGLDAVAQRAPTTPALQREMDIARRPTARRRVRRPDPTEDGHSY